MANKKERTFIQQCDKHKTDDLWYRDHHWERGVCIQCLDRKVDVLWERVVDKKKDSDD